MNEKPVSNLFPAEGFIRQHQVVQLEHFGGDAKKKHFLNP
jgi:hypothetical protein